MAESAPRVAIIVQARMTSTRLPGKVLKKALEKTLLEYLIERLRRVKLADEICIATTTNGTDEPIVRLCDALGVRCVRGSEADVLARYHVAAIACRADVVVRVTSDCPLIDPATIDELIAYFLEHRGSVDFVTNSLKRSYPLGMEAEVTSFKALDEAFREATATPDREHVMPFIHRQPERYRVVVVSAPSDYSAYRWTVDTAEDYELVRRILEALYPVKPTFSMEDILDLMKQKPEWATINQNVRQKAYGE